MMASVSMLMRSSGAAMPLWCTNGSISDFLRREFAHVGDAAGDGRGGHGGGTGEMRPGARPLAVLEVAVGAGNHALLAAEMLAAGEKAHGAAGLPPLETRRGEDAVEPFGLGSRLHPAGTGHADGPDAVGDVPPPQNLGGRAQVAQPTVRARADER